MKHLIILIVLLTSASAQAEISWIPMQDYKVGDLSYCPAAEEWINENESKVQELIDDGIVSYRGSAGFYTLNIDQDEPLDLFVVYSGPSMCGTGGCPSK